MQVDFSFPKAKRLLRSGQFKQVLDQGAKVVCPELVAFALPREGQGRLGLIVSKKVGNAVVRNKVKRCLREVYRKSSGRHLALDFVFIARYRISESDFEQLQKAFERCCQRLEKKLYSEAKITESVSTLGK